MYGEGTHGRIMPLHSQSISTGDEGLAPDSSANLTQDPYPKSHQLSFEEHAAKMLCESSYQAVSAATVH